jgi:type IX secretion system PorP/SprF family membrane protein
MKMKSLNKILLGIAVIGSAFTSNAQDVHFSNYEYSPLQLNPALAGANAVMQANINYRSQWASVGDPFNTIAASVEGRFNEKKRMKKGIFAGGLNFYNDKSGNLTVSTTKANLNLAYHLILDRNSTLGLGIYTGFGQRTFDPNGGKWGNQYDGTQYNSTLPSNEVFNSNQFGFFDAGTGLVYTYKSGEGYMTQNNHRLFNGGVAFYHVNQPSYSFINNDDEQLPLRWSIFANGIIGMSNSNTAIMPGVYFNRQRTNMEILYGTYFRFTIGQNSVVTGRNKALYFSLGAFHRWGDALVAKTMIDWNGIALGFAYDFNLSSLSEASRGRGGMEFFLKYEIGPGGLSRASIR